MANDNLTAVLHGIEDLRLVIASRFLFAYYISVRRLILCVVYPKLFRNNDQYQQFGTIKCCWKWIRSEFVVRMFITWYMVASVILLWRHRWLSVMNRLASFIKWANQWKAWKSAIALPLNQVYRADIVINAKPENTICARTWCFVQRHRSMVTYRDIMHMRPTFAINCPITYLWKKVHCSSHFRLVFTLADVQRSVWALPFWFLALGQSV